MLHAPIAYRAMACGLAALLTFGLMHLLDTAAAQHRAEVLATVASAQGVHQVQIVGTRAPRS